MFDLNENGCRYPGSISHPLHKKWKATPEQIGKAFEALEKISQALEELRKLGLSATADVKSIEIRKGDRRDEDEQYDDLVGTVTFPC